MAQHVLDKLQARFGNVILATHNNLGNETALIEATRLREIALFLRDDKEMVFNMPIDCTAVDWFNKREVRFEVVYHIYSTTHKQRLRLKIDVSENDCSCPSLTLVWPGMNWHEREVWDMYGIRFIGHPNLKRVLLYEEFQGHPLRKDYPLTKRQPLMEMRNVPEVPTQIAPPPSVLNQP